jgi:TRAP-type C4-dicarboxylate transport system permease small subunit
MDGRTSVPGSVWVRTAAQLDRLGEVLLALSALMLLLMLALMGTEIVTRALLRTSTQVSDEYSGYLFTWMTMAGFYYAQRSDRFLRVDSLRGRLSPRARAAADAVTSLLGATLIAVLLYATWATFRTSIAFDSRSIQPSQTLLWIPQLVMPAGLALLLVAFLHSSAMAFLRALGALPLPRSPAPRDA